jgi:hypothetical protein
MKYSRHTAVLALAAVFLVASDARGECPLDHYFLAQEDGLLFVDKSRIYRHGDTTEGYYPLSWSAIYQRWSVGEPGFSDTSDPAYGFPPEIELEGTPNVDYQIWFEVLDLSPDFKIYMNDGSWIEDIGDRYNLSNKAEHHVHMKYCAYVPGSPAPDYPFYVTYRLVDDIGPYQSTPPFSLVFNVPTPTVEATEPAYRGELSSLTEAEITFEFHRPIAVVGGPPVTITDNATHSADYYTGYFDYTVSPDNYTLTLTQSAGVLPDETWLEIALTDYTRDAATDFAAVPFTHFVYAVDLAGDCDGDGDVDLDDAVILINVLLGTDTAPDHVLRADVDDSGTANGLDLQMFMDVLIGS